MHLRELIEPFPDEAASAGFDEHSATGAADAFAFLPHLLRLHNGAAIGQNVEHVQS